MVKKTLEGQQMNFEFKNKLYKLGEYLLNEGMSSEFLRLTKLAQEASLGKMPGEEVITSSSLLDALVGENMESNEQYDKWMSSFLDLNADVFVQYSPVKRLGGGVDGEAFILDDGRVLKIFHEKGLIGYYRQELKKLHDGTATPETLMIYDQGIFDMPDDRLKFVGWVVMEYTPNQANIGYDSFYSNIRQYIKINVDLSEVTEITSDSLRALAEKCWAGFREMYPEDELLQEMRYLGSPSPGMPPMIQEEVKMNHPRGYEVQDNSEHIIKYIMSVLYSLLHERTDLHSGNLGYRGDTPVFFDAYHPWLESADETEPLVAEASDGGAPDFSWIENSEPIMIARGYFEDPVAWQERFLDLNSDKLVEWEVGRELGSGAFGQAWQLGEERVLKIFGNTSVIEEYKRLSEAPFDPETGSKHDLRVYDFGVFVMPDMPLAKEWQSEKSINERDLDLGYAIVEALKTPKKFLPEDFDFYSGKPSLDRLLQVVGTFAKMYFKMYDYTDPGQDMSKVMSEFKYYLSRPRKRKQYHSLDRLRQAGIDMYGLQDGWIEEFFASTMESLLRGHRDTKPENMGYRGDTPVFFDAAMPTFDYVLPEDMQIVRDWDKDAQLALLSEYLGIKTAQIRQNLDYNEAEDMVLTPELAKQYGLEHLLPKQLELGRFGEVFGNGTRIRYFVDEVFKTPDESADFAAKQDWVDRFLDKNSDVLAKYDPVRHLGSGAYADAWETDDGRVIKIIRDNKDLSFYKEQQEALHSGEGSQRNIMVYDMGIFDVPWAQEPYDVRRLKKMSWVVIEKLNPIRDFVRDYESQLRGLAEFLKDKDSEIQIDDNLLKSFKENFAFMKRSIEGEVGTWNNVPPPIEDTEAGRMDYAIAIEEWFTMSQEYREDIHPVFKDVEQKVGLPANWSSNIIHAMVFHLLQGDFDLHSGNVGFRGNQPVYFDPSNRIPDNMSPSIEYSSGRTTNSTENETVQLDNTFIIDEPDETMDEEETADHTNKTFDWEHS